MSKGRQLFDALDEEVVGQIRSATNGNYALGNERFQREVEVALGRRVKRGQSGRPRKSPAKDETQGELL